MARGQASRASCAAAIATVAIETASTFQPVREAFWLSEDWRRANLRYWPYYGRGFIQLTWESNYRSVGTRIGVDLQGDPELATRVDVAALVFADYWQHHGRENLILEACDRHDWREVRRLVQGGSDGLDRLVAICGRLLN